MISTSSNKIDEIVAPDEIETYVSMPSCLLQGCSNDLIIFRADGGNHFTHYGIYEGMFLIFDVSKDFKDGHLSCYLNNSVDDRPKFKVSDKPLDGYRHLGRLVASMKIMRCRDGRRTAKSVCGGRCYPQDRWDSSTSEN